MLVIIGLIPLFSMKGSLSTLAQGEAAFVRHVRDFDSDGIGFLNPAGLAFSPRANSFLVAEARQPAGPPAVDTALVKITPFEERADAARIAAVVKDPINIAFDDRFNRLLIYESRANRLLVVAAGAGGNIDPRTLGSHDAGRFGLLDAQGMTVDPANGTLFILDALRPSLVRVTPEADGGFDAATVSQVELQGLELVDPRGLAFDPSTGHLHLYHPAEQELYELTQTGQLVATRDLSDMGLSEPEGMVFAPSGDQTDDPARMHLYIADSGRVPANPFSAFSARYQIFQPSVLTAATAGDEAGQTSGTIVELSFTALTAPAASTFTSSLVNTVDMSKNPFSPPSPDPSGLAYISSSNHLIMDDGEVEETVSGITHFEGVNVWEMTLSGSVVDTANISKVDPIDVPITNEPTGVAWNPANGHYFFVQDDGDAVFELAPGTDGQYFSTDDIVTRFDLSGQNPANSDGEGLAFDSWNNRIFVADGVNAEIYEYTLSGSLVKHFDVGQYGVADPESVEFNPATGTLYVMSSNRSSPVIVETTTSGDLLQTIDISAAGARTAAGLAYAPASDGSGEQRFYIVDRAIDNNSDPNIIDGKMYELTAPTPINGPVPPTANDDSASTVMDTPVTIDVAANDTDPNDNLDPTTANNTCNPTCSNPGNGTLLNTGDGSFTYTPNAGFSGSDSFVYEICDTDGLCDTAAVTITIGLSTIEVRVAASSDDAEEATSGGMTLGSSDLELVLESSVQTVGMRFNGITIPRGAAIISAYVQFQTDEVNSEATDLIIEGEASDNAATFVSSSGNIASRPRTSASAAWSPPPWTTRGQAGPDQQTPDISTVIQEIVSRSGWASGNSLAIIITGSGKRVAEAYDGVSTAAPLLHLEYSASGNHFPGVTISAPTDGSTFFDGDSISFTGTASDFEDGDLTASLAWESDLDGAIGTGGSFSRSDLSVGDHIVTATVVDSEGETASDTVTISVFAPGTAVFVGAGDIADCNRTTDDATADLLDTIPGTVYTLGDNVYPNGTEAEYNDCYDPTWGRHKARTVPASGNHEYDTGTAAPYFNYFGAAAGDPDKGYYSTDLGNWHIIVLNTQCGAQESGGCGSNDPQGQWLQADLAANPRACTLAIMHKPLFSSTTSSSAGQDFWPILYNAEVDVVLSGHAHNYERFAPQDPNGVADPVNGIREFVVGTGGTSHSSFGQQIAPNSVARDDNAHGVLKLTLKPTSYDWEFVPIPGDTFTDSGSAACVSSSSNKPPVAADDAYTTDEDTPLNMAAPGVLGNDSDADGNPLTAVLDVGPANGTLTLNPDGSFTYNPNADFNGADSFTYKANDGTADSNAATVSITVNPVNDAPVAVDDAYTTEEDTVLNVSQGVLANDSDVDGDPLTAGLVTDVSNGTLNLATDGSFTYTPDPGFVGADSFTYRANDGQADSNTATVSITVNPVNDPPVAVDDAYTTDEDTPLNMAAPGVLGNDSDADGNPLTAVLDTPPSNGSLTLNLDGSFTYSPDADFNGADSFTYRANDGLADSNVATVTITVNPVNDAPGAADDAYSTDEDTALNVAAPGVLGNDSDADGDPLTAAMVSDVSNGTLVLNADGSFTYTPAPGFVGTDSFTYRANDGPADSNLATVSINVNGAPTSVTDIQPNTMQAGTTINVTITGSSFAAGANVTFESGGGPAPAAANIVVAADGKSLTATITAKSGGPPRDRIWDVRVTNPDGSSALLAAGFTVTP